MSESALGSQAFKAGSFTAAETHFSRALELIPAHEQAGRMVLLNNRAAVREKLGDLQGVVEDTSQALSVDKTYRRALTRRARAYEALGQLDCALEDYLVINHIDGPQQPDEAVDAAIQRLIALVGKTLAEELWKTRPQGTKLAHLPKPGFCRTFYYTFSHEQRAFMSGAASQLEFKDAQDALGKLSNGEAKGAQHLKLGAMAKHTLEFARAAVHFEEAAKLGAKPVRAHALEELGTLYLLAGDAKSARESLGASLALAEAAPTLIKLAGMAIEDGDVARGKELLVRAEAAAAGSAEQRGDVCFHRSQMHLVELDLEGARAALEAALALVPDFGLAHMQLGVVLFRMERVDDALAELQRACEVVPELPEVHNYYGEVLMTAQRVAEADRKYADAIAADPACALPLLNRGVMLMNAAPGALGQAELASAGALFDQAVSIDPTCELAYAHRASYFFHLGDFDSAMREYALAVQHAKTKMDAAEYLGLKAFCQARANAARKLGV